MCTRGEPREPIIIRKISEATYVVLNEEQCRGIVEKKLQRDSMTDFSYVSNEIITTEYASGRMGQYFTLKATVINNESPADEKTIDFFIKYPAPKDTVLYKLDREGQIFKKEVDLYSTAFPEIFDGFENYTIMPEYFFGVNDEIIILEDMRLLGFEIRDMSIPFDLDHCTLVMKAMAEFHAKSIIYEAKNNKDIGEEFSDCLHAGYCPTDKNQWKSIAKTLVKGIIGMIDLVEDLEESGKKKLKEKFLSLDDGYFVPLPSNKFKNVLCHGSLYADNILFKYDSEKKPVDCCFVDYQTAKYNTPAYDICAFLHLATLRKFRDDHANELFKIYHETLTTSLSKAGLNCETILEWQDFLVSLDEIRTEHVIRRTVYAMFRYVKNLFGNIFDSEDKDGQKIIISEDGPAVLCDFFRDSEVFREKITDSLLELHDTICAESSD